VIDPHDSATVPLPGVAEVRSLMPATLAGRCTNGHERGRGSIVHAVPISAREKSLGIDNYAQALCGKTHGPRSAGWSSRPGAQLTCPRCRARAHQATIA
jgi:hypothetical protein